MDERIVKSKHRSGIRQYIKNKPVKFGLKLWVIADSRSGYTYDFSVYTGSKERNPNAIQVSSKGLGYDVVRELCKPLEGQGYHIFFDNFYTSKTLVQDLFECKLPSSGTTCENRRGFPVTLKDGKQWARKVDRGSMRWQREGNLLALQWKDTKVVTMLTTIDNASEYVNVTRKIKQDGKFVAKEVPQPITISHYNKFMNAVDKSDQYLSKYNLLRKCLRWWKTLFFHLIDISIINGFILYRLYAASNPNIKELQRSSRYSVLEFHEEVARQLGGLEMYDNPPVYKATSNVKPSAFETEHLVMFSDVKRNCKVCYKLTKTVLKVHSYCTAPQCKVYLHCTKDKNCFKIWHSKEFHV